MRIFYFILFCLFFSKLAYSQSIKIDSPDGNMHVEIDWSKQVQFNCFADGNAILENAVIGLVINKNDIGNYPKLISQRETIKKEILNPIVPLKYSTINNIYKAVELRFNGGYSVEFRVFNDGFAYRFILDMYDEIEVQYEKMDLYWPSHTLVHIQQPNSFRSAYEEPYNHIYIEEWKSSQKFSTLPILSELENGYKVLFSESNLKDYPCLFIKGNGNNSTSSIFPKYPLKFGLNSQGKIDAIERADYIAKTGGKRVLPWRYFFITKKDAKIVENTMTIRLASSNKVSDTSWIKPGLSTWDFWNGSAIYGPNINFESGCNQDTYKYFIDFASQMQIPYFILDEGWALHKNNPYKENAKVNMKELIEYAKSKNVNLILWLPWETVDQHPELFETYHRWGISGMKIDFMNRSDQWMVNFYEKVAQRAAKNKLLILFHGSFKPSGLEYEYPNVLAYEGVRGMEQMKECIPTNTVYIPFMRNAVGPMDYTPGAMVCMQPECYNARRPESASIGTRAYQMALFTLFETGMQMMADSPTQYLKEKECTQYITKIPITWDETIGLDGRIGEYIIVAKRKNKNWYLSGITNEKSRKIKINLDFLEKNTLYKMILFKDGKNANKNAMDYTKEEHKNISSSTIWEIDMARNGGWTAVITAE